MRFARAARSSRSSSSRANAVHVRFEAATARHVHASLSGTLLFSLCC